MQKILAGQMGSAIGEIDQRIRGARKAGIIRSGPRGLAAPIMTKAELAQHILCMASRNVVDAEATRKRLSDECIYVPDPANSSEILPDGTTFGQAVTMIVEGKFPTNHYDDHIEVGKDGEIAFILISPEKGRPAVRLLFSSSEEDREWYYPHGSRSYLTSFGSYITAFDTAYSVRAGFWFTYPCMWLAGDGRTIDRAGSDPQLEA